MMPPAGTETAQTSTTDPVWIPSQESCWSQPLTGLGHSVADNQFVPTHAERIRAGQFQALEGIGTGVRVGSQNDPRGVTDVHGL